MSILQINVSGRDEAVANSKCNDELPDVDTSNTRKSSLKHRRPNKDSNHHQPLCRKISFPPEEVFHSSVADGDNVELQRVLKHHRDELDINKANHVGVTALHQAVLNKNMDSVKILLFYGCHVNVCDAHGFTPLHTASACGYMSIASILIVHGGDVFSCTHSGQTAADVAKDNSMGRMLQEEMIRQLHGQQQQQQMTGGILYWILTWMITTLIWMWNYICTCFTNSHKKRT